MINETKIIKKWLEKTIIGLNLCPFAKEPFENGQINLKLVESISEEACYQSFITELDFLL